MNDSELESTYRINSMIFELRWLFKYIHILTLKLFYEKRCSPDLRWNEQLGFRGIKPTDTFRQNVNKWSKTVNVFFIVGPSPQ